jgi:hypothetical protein
LLTKATLYLEQTDIKDFFNQGLLGFLEPFIILTMLSTHPSSPLRCLIGLTNQVDATVFYWGLVSGNALSWTVDKDMLFAKYVEINLISI